MTRPPMLPRPVPFPVYGLTADVPATRNLVLWNDPKYLWTVSLTHELVPSGHRVTVETLRKAARPHRDGAEPNLPVLLGHAAFDAVIAAIDLPTRSSKAKSALPSLMDAELALIDSDDDGDPELHDWDKLTVVANDSPVPARSRLINTSRAVLVELPDVIVRIATDPECDIKALRLVDVRDRLDDYPWPSIREHMRDRREPPPAPSRRQLLGLHLGLRDILANARDAETDPRELLARIEHVADHLLHVNLPGLDRRQP